jgi:AraC-like DNA-binding protein
MTDFLANVHYNSRDFATPEQALAAWRAIMSVTVHIDPLNEDLTPLGGDLSAFHAKADAWAMGRLMFGRAATSAGRAERTAERARNDGSEHHIFMTTQEGHASGDFNGQPMRCPTGSTYAMDKAQPFTAIYPTMLCNIVSVPRFLLEGATRTTRSFHGVVFAGPLGRLFAEHMRSTIQVAPQLMTRDAAVIEQTTMQLLAACLAAQAGEVRSDALLAFAVRNDIQRYIEDHLSRHDLGPTIVCEALSLSRATAYRAFAGTDGIAKYIQSRRLGAARAMLGHPSERRPVAEIADAVGFSDHASFSHAYKRMHGETPRETREKAATMAEDKAAVPTGRDDDFHSWIRELRASLVQAGKL